jgi:hypothetical protein
MIGAVPALWEAIVTHEIVGRVSASNRLEQTLADHFECGDSRVPPSTEQDLIGPSGDRQSLNCPALCVVRKAYLGREDHAQ